MLVVSKKKILLFRIIMWVGVAIAVIGAIFYYATSESFIDIYLGMLAGGLLITVVGSGLMQRMFRCPNCKKTVLTGDTKIDLRTSNCPTHCSNCGTPVQLVD